MQEQTPPPSLLQPAIAGRVVDGRYRIERKIGAGGMGEVFLARQLNVDRAVALKLLPSERVGDVRAVAQFLTETTAVSRLTSPHTVTLYDAGRIEDGAPYIAMELLEGATLRARLSAGPMLLAEAMRIMDGVTLSLAEAHARGIAHLDLKPANVFLAKTPGHSAWVKVLDFGLARLADGAAQEHSAAGTLRYMAPERIRGEAVDARADVYALALVAYEILSGAHPFEELEREALIDAQLSESPPPLDEVTDYDVPAALAQLLARALAKQPRLRPADASAFRAAWRAAFDLAAEPREADGATAEGSAQVRWEDAPISETVVSRTLADVTPAQQAAAIASSWRRRALRVLALTVIAGGVLLYTRSRVVVTHAEPSGTPLADTSSVAAAAATATAVSIVIESVPTGAAAWLDGVQRGTTPLTLDLAHRDPPHELRLSLAGYEPHQQSLPTHRPATIVVRLAPSPVVAISAQTATASTAPAPPPAVKPRSAPAIASAAVSASSKPSIEARVQDYLGED